MACAPYGAPIETNRTLPTRQQVSLSSDSHLQAKPQPPVPPQQPAAASTKSIRFLLSLQPVPWLKHVHRSPPTRVLGFDRLVENTSDVLRHRVDCDDFSGIVHLPSTTPTTVEHSIRLEQPMVLVQNLKVWCHEDCQSNRVVSVESIGAGRRLCTGCVRLVVRSLWAGCGRAGHVLVFSARWTYQPAALTAVPVGTALADPSSRPWLRSGQLFWSSNRGKGGPSWYTGAGVPNP